MVRSVAVVGAGVMGAGIAQVLAAAGCEVHLSDLRDDVLARARERIEHGRFGLRRGVELGKLSAGDADAALARIATGTEVRPDVDLVVEAVYEDLALKLDVFRELDRTVAPGAILASNTSGFPIAALAAATGRPERVVGWHFASPVPAMRFSEIVAADATAQSTVDAVVELAARAGKNPVVVRDQPLAWGFVANRILAAAAREADRIVAEGVATPEQVDTLLKDCFRWPSGLFELVGGTSGGWEGDAAAAPAAPAPHDRLLRYLFPSTARGS